MAKNKTSTQSQPTLAPAPQYVGYDPDPLAAFMLHPGYELVAQKGKSRATGRQHWTVALAALFFWGVFTLLAFQNAERNVNANARALAINGVVIERKFEDSPRANADRWFITYRFDLPDGRSYTKTLSVEGVEYDYYPMNGKIPVKFLPEDPTISTLKIRELNLIDPELLRLMIILPGLVAVPSLLWAIYRAWLNRRYEQHGVPVRAEITESKGEVRGGIYYLTVRYKFALPDGKTRRGTSTLAREDMRGKPLPAVGSQVAVLYVSDWYYRLI
ncbi:MAG: hypothetical protein OHK0023_24220 [Anaerolineae bacterium]